MPRLSANIGFLWPDLPPLERIDAAANAGFRAVEMHWPYDVPPEAVKAALARRDMICLALNTIPGDLARGEFGLGAVSGREADFAASVDQSIAYSRHVGIGAIHAMAGRTPMTQESVDVFVSNLVAAADKAAAAGITLLLEPLNARDVPGYFYSTVEAAADIAARVDRPNVLIMFDCYHLAISEGDLFTRLERYLPLIGHVQIAAVPSRAEPDEGEISYPAIFRHLEAIGYAGWVGCEYKPRASTDLGLAWIERLGARQYLTR